MHATAAGLLVDGLDLAGCRSPAALLDAVARRARARPGALIWGHGKQDRGWTVPGRGALDRAAAGCPVYLSRVDVHSALASSALVAHAPAAVGAAGWSDGPLSADAHHHVRRAALAAVDPTTRAAAQEGLLGRGPGAGVDGGQRGAPDVVVGVGRERTVRPARGADGGRCAAAAPTTRARSGRRPG